MTQTISQTMMRALVQDTYGGPEVLRPAAVPQVEPGPGQVRVRVHASSVNARDWHLMRGEPKIARLLDRSVFGRHAPKVTIRGTDFAGRVDAVGRGVTRWTPGDRVFGEADAAWAEAVIADESAVAAVPEGITMEHAAVLPLAGTTALLCLCSAEAHAGQRLLINGASGGVGTFALQIAHGMGLHVTAVCSTRNAAQARALGADAVVEYDRNDFCKAPQRYDIVLDLVGNRALRDLRRLVRRDGTLVLSGGGVPGAGRWLGPIGLLLRAQLLARLPGPRIITPRAVPTAAQLEELAELVRSGAVTPAIDRAFDLDEGAAAVRYMETTHPRGKVALSIADDPDRGSSDRE
jgi:NADPH:quinone reductase-like Zn-dependent oxidoreductase